MHHGRGGTCGGARRRWMSCCHGTCKSRAADKNRQPHDRYMDASDEGVGRGVEAGAEESTPERTSERIIFARLQSCKMMLTAVTTSA